MKNLKIWVSYHKDSLYDEFGLGKLDKDIFIPYNLSSTPDEENINHLNKHWNEICTMYYVWKNKKKSDWVGFCGYRRLFDNIVDIKSDECLYIAKIELQSSIFKSYCEEHFRGDILNAMYYMKSHNYDKEFNEIMISNEFVINDCYIMSWENFNKLCEFMFGILFYLDDIYKLEMNPDNHVKRYHELYDKYHLRYTKDYQTRAFSFIAERLISIWITSNTRYKSVQKVVHLMDGTPKIVFKSNSSNIDMDYSEEVAGNLVNEIKSNEDLYVLKIYCDKSESDIIPLLLERKRSLRDLLSSNNIPDCRYKIKLRGYSDNYNINNCVVAIRKPKTE